MLPASVLNRLRRRAPTLLLGAVEGAKAFLLAEAQRLLGAPVVAVVPDNDALHRLSENLRAYAPREILLKFPALTGNPFKGEAPHARLLHERAAALGALASGGDFSFLVATAPAAAMRLTPFAVFDEAAMALRPGGAMNLEEFLRRLEAAGYLHADRVVEPGEYSHRGGVVDVFPPFAPQPSAGAPIRVEFFGDRIESLRRFDPATQRSAGPVESALVTCESEIVLSAAAARRWRDAALAHGASQDAAERTARGLERRDRFPGIEFHAAWLYKNTSSLEALLRDRFKPDEMLLVADEPPLCRNGVRRASASYAAMAAASEETAAPSADEVFLEKLPLLDSPHVSLHELPPPPTPLPPGEGDEEDRVVSLQTAKPPRFNGNLEMLAEYLHELLRQEGRRVVLGVSSLGRGRRLAEALRAGGLDVECRPETSLETLHETALTIGKLPVLDGFEWPGNNLFILAESDMFEEARLLAPSKPAHAAAASIAEVFSEGLRGLAEGDYVVHADHGVGKFAALRTPHVANGRLRRGMPGIAVRGRENLRSPGAPRRRGKVRLEGRASPALARPPGKRLMEAPARAHGALNGELGGRTPGAQRKARKLPGTLVPFRYVGAARFRTGLPLRAHTRPGARRG
jgi:transcription-repair coupling factor (superfamily II helicase)